MITGDGCGMSPRWMPQDKDRIAFALLLLAAGGQSTTRPCQAHPQLHRKRRYRAQQHRTRQRPCHPAAPPRRLRTRRPTPCRRSRPHHRQTPQRTNHKPPPPASHTSCPTADSPTSHARDRRSHESRHNLSVDGTWTAQAIEINFLCSRRIVLPAARAYPEWWTLPTAVLPRCGVGVESGVQRSRASTVDAVSLSPRPTYRCVQPRRKKSSKPGHWPPHDSES